MLLRGGGGGGEGGGREGKVKSSKYKIKLEGQIWNLSIKTTQFHFNTTMVTTVGNHQPVIH